MTDRKFILAVVGVAVLGVVIFDYSREYSPPGCAAGVNEICPSDKWMKTYKKANEMSTALQAGIPGGYVFNAQTGKFVKLPTQPPAPVPPPPPAPTSPVKH